MAPLGSGAIIIFLRLLIYFLFLFSVRTIRKSFLLLCLFALAGLGAAAQGTPAARYAVSRGLLAEETFKKLVEASSTLDQLNLAADLSASMRVTQEHPELRTAVIENCIFAYCCVSDNLKTEANRRVVELDGERHYTYQITEAWAAVGQEYTEKRLELERALSAGNLPVPDAASVLTLEGARCQSEFAAVPGSLQGLKGKWNNLILS